ncbi:IclR family transcriptional regulator [Brevibacterium sp. VCM10]|uniref:IclR family transcriptional regulator n=1 Tax=Brevibacterium sp. VCM10 TaxID=1381751 RepID=UPI000470B6AC|nr:IclR family transcriptional regulator [Brevibacterium sp. VCM10]
MLERMIEILEVFKVEGGPLTASEISRRTGIPMASTHRLVGELLRVRILTRDDSHRLTIGMRLWEIAAGASTLRSLRELALPFMNDVMLRTHASTLLCVLDGTDVVNLETLNPSGPSATNLTRPGVRLPTLGSSPGIALLAFAEEETREAVLKSADLVRFTSRTPLDEREIRRLLTSTVSDGHVIARGWMWTNSIGIAVPILGGDGHAMAALSATVPSDSANTEGVAALLKTTATAIARAGRAGEESEDPGLTLLRLQLRRVTGQQ